MLQKRYMSSRIDTIFNESIATSISEPDVEIRPFDPVIENKETRLPHTFRFTIEFYYGLGDVYLENNTLELIEKKMRRVVENTSLDTSDLYLLSDTDTEQQAEFTKLYSYHYGYVIFLNMSTDDFATFIRFFNSLSRCFPIKSNIWTGMTAETTVKTPYLHYIREYSAITIFDVIGAEKLLSEYYKNIDNLDLWLSETKSFKSVFNSFLKLFFFTYE